MRNIVLGKIIDKTVHCQTATPYCNEQQSTTR